MYMYVYICMYVLSMYVAEAERMMNAETYWAQLSVGLFYILGSLLFVVGSILFLPQFYSRDSVPAGKSKSLQFLKFLYISILLVSYFMISCGVLH